MSAWTIAFVTALAVLNAHFNWASSAAELLCLVLLIVAVAHYRGFKHWFETRFNEELWHPLRMFVWGVLVALAALTLVEIYLAYLYSCSSAFKASWSYKLCVVDFGPYYLRADGHYAPVERYILWFINSLYEHAHELELYVFLPGLFVAACAIAAVAARIRQRRAARAAAAQAAAQEIAAAQGPAAPVQGAPAQPTRWARFTRFVGRRWARLMGWLVNFDRPMTFVAGAVLIFGLFGFTGGLVEGDRDSYAISVAMLNADTKMRGDLGEVRVQVLDYTRNLDRLVDLLKPNTDQDNKPAREEFQKAVHDLADELRGLDLEIDQAKRSVPPSVLEPYLPERLAPATSPPSYKPIEVTNPDVLRELRRSEVPIIKGPVNPSGAQARLANTAADVKRFNDRELPDYQMAIKETEYALYMKSGLDERGGMFLADFLLSSGLKASETADPVLRDLSQAQENFRKARDQVACINLIVAVGQWLDSGGKDQLNRVLTKYVVRDRGFVEGRDYSDAVGNAFPGLSPGQAEIFSPQLVVERTWQRSVEAGMRQFRTGSTETNAAFDGSATGAVGRFLSGACGMRMTFASFQKAFASL